MGAERSDDLERVAGAVSDGTPVDWGREKAATPELSEELFQLSQLEKIGEAHGGVDTTSEALTQSADSAHGTSMSDEPGEPAMVSWDRLRVLAKVGQGTGGKVYRAFDPALQMEVALKRRRRDPAWSRNMARTLVDEGRRLARVRHPNVLVVHGAAEYEGWVGIWTDFVRGKSLEEYLGQAGLLSAREAALIGLDLCRALAAVHAAGLVHRDVKPSNVMREDGGRIILADFGSTGETPSPIDSSGGFHGTPLYMSPEQLRNEAAGASADLYGLGVLMYRMVSGRYPIEAKSLQELEAKHRAGEFVPLRERRADLPLDFVAVVERATASDPRNRFRSAAEMERALAATIGAAPVLRDQPPIPRWIRRIAPLVGAAAVVGIVLAIIFWPHPVPDPVPPVPNPIEDHVAPPALTATVTLFRRSDGRRVPLSATGGRIAPGDRISMEVRGTEPMYLYVLDDDNEGSPFVLFPLPGLEATNPLEAGVRHQLPGRQNDSLMNYWIVTSPAANERVIAIASRGPLDEMESVVRTLPPVERGRKVRYARVGDQALIRLRGIGGMEAEPIQPENSRVLLDQAIRRLTERGKGDVWVWETNLQNRAP
jgi:serine/threonine protein kinase